MVGSSVSFCEPAVVVFYFGGRAVWSLAQAISRAWLSQNACLDRPAPLPGNKTLCLAKNFDMYRRISPDFSATTLNGARQTIMSNKKHHVKNWYPAWCMGLALVGCSTQASRTTPSQHQDENGASAIFHPVIASDLGLVVVLHPSAAPTSREGARTDIGHGILVVAKSNDVAEKRVVTLVGSGATCVAEVTSNVLTWIEYKYENEMPGSVDAFAGLMVKDSGCAAEELGWLLAIEGAHPNARVVEPTSSYEPYRETFFASSPSLALASPDPKASGLDTLLCPPRDAENYEKEPTQVWIDNQQVSTIFLDGEPFGLEVGTERYLVFRGDTLTVAQVFKGRLKYLDATNFAFPIAYDCL